MVPAVSFLMGVLRRGFWILPWWEVWDSWALLPWTELPGGSEGALRVPLFPGQTDRCLWKQTPDFRAVSLFYLGRVLRGV